MYTALHNLSVGRIVDTGRAMTRRDDRPDKTERAYAAWFAGTFRREPASAGRPFWGGA